VSVIDHLNQVWNTVLGLLSKVVIPDWGALINLLPIFLVLGVLGPIFSILVLGWVIYLVRRPRTSVRYSEQVRAAPLDASGAPVFPPGLPHCLRHALIFPSGTGRCAEDGEELWVTCPMCGLGRSAQIRTCGNCGLVLNVKNRERIVAASGPPPGGAAIA
jgi:hypothetical protein